MLSVNSPWSRTSARREQARMTTMNVERNFLGFMGGMKPELANPSILKRKSHRKGLTWQINRKRTRTAETNSSESLRSSRLCGSFAGN
jgi:hypothetical protein